uniref:Uncharacterized protein n=1 Tax=Triticum urartu TaxID=4572 RepID=A0A8R7U7N0_TRIUA
MSADKKEEYLKNRHQPRAEKKVATLISANYQQVSQEHASSFLSLQRTPLRNITNTQKYVSTAASSGSIDHQPADINVGCEKQRGQGW